MTVNNFDYTGVAWGSLDVFYRITSSILEYTDVIGWGAMLDTVILRHTHGSLDPLFEEIIARSLAPTL